MNSNPVVTAMAIIVGVSVVGLIITYWRRTHLYRGYEEYSSDAQALASRLKADVFRDGIDLVMSGNYGKLPTVIRFSYADNTPGFNVKMRAPATFTMAIAPKGAKSPEGRVQMRTPDEMFDTRFVTRTNDPMQARVFIASKAAFAQIQKLCCSAQTFLTVTSGVVELSELTVPTPYAAKHIQNHLDSMAALAVSLQQMPGADAIKITPAKKEYSTIIRAALAVGVLTAIVAVASAMYDRGGSAAANGPNELLEKMPTGVTPAEAQLLGGLFDFRVAREADFDADAVAWARAYVGREISGRISASFTGDGTPETAYVLVRERGAHAGNKRVAVLAGGNVAYDAGYPELAIAGIVPRANFSGIQWVGSPPPPDGDGLLLVRKRVDVRSATVIYLSKGRLETAVPTSYLNVGIQ
ncbi:MAG: hypothetical protein L0Z53_25855 [Acidobacteriales bacterium]|nr:hypothetical protein [Terriglobales bacterium]